MAAEAVQERRSRSRSARRASKTSEIADRRAEVSRLLLLRWEQQEIARDLGVSEATISGDVAALRERWMAQAASDFAERRGRDLEALDGDEARLRERLLDMEDRDLVRGVRVIVSIIEARQKLVGQAQAGGGGALAEFDQALRELGLG